MAENVGLRITSLSHNMVAGKSHVGLVWESDSSQVLGLEVPFGCSLEQLPAESGEGRARALDRAGLDHREPAALITGRMKSRQVASFVGGSLIPAAMLPVLPLGMW